MKKTLAAVSVPIVALVAAACGSESTTSTNTGATPDAETPTSTVATTVPVETTEPPFVETTTTPADFTPVTEAPSPDAPVTTAPAVTAVPTTPAPPPTAPPSPTTGTAVVYGGGGGPGPWAPLAWWDGAAWNQAGYALDGSFVVAPAPSISTVAVTSLDLPDGPGQVVTGLARGEEDYYCVGDETGPAILPAVEIPDTPVSLGYDALAVTADWPLQPRPVQQIGADNPEYATIGAGFVDAPTADAGTVSQAVRADLDGDGIDEVLITYQYLTDDQFGAENDFSVVYARLPNADGTVEDQLLEQYVLDDPAEFPTIGRFSIAAVADLNGDGVMEIATRNTFWESAGIAVWSFDGDQLSVIGGGGCGV